MINGAHVIIYSKDAEADRNFFRETLGLAHVDVGHGWLIFALPPSEVAVHPTEGNDKHELILMCDSVEVLTAQLKEKGISCSDVEEQPWGRLVYLTLPGGSKLGAYEPKHERPQSS